MEPIALYEALIKRTYPELETTLNIKDKTLTIQVSKPKPFVCVFDTEIYDWGVIKRTIGDCLSFNYYCCVCGETNVNVIRPCKCADGWICIMCMLKYYRTVGTLEYMKCFICNKKGTAYIITYIIKTILDKFFDVDNLSKGQIFVLANAIHQHLDEIIDNFQTNDLTICDNIMTTLEKYEIIKPVK